MRTNIRKEKYVICNNKAYIFWYSVHYKFLFHKEISLGL